ncbi:TlpA disulfide reductase family protein [Pedobacter psychrodurus]|jgi:thiol-disulfide isomerase/thioredoxin|uniref:TlpA disulfide reductase family protein n=1 Tax=Pedobacter psychrodurus TaxID=2530456 RepID=UPI0029317E53|nr:TlpA disulfide reductase family protein [Pedobacter psychrodurus]
MKYLYKKQILLFLLVCSITAAAQEVNLKGKILGLKADKISLIRLNGKNLYEDTISVKNGEFYWSEHIKSPQKAMLRLPDYGFVFYIEPGNIDVGGDVATNNYWVTGSTTDDQGKAFYSSLKKLTVKQDDLLTQLEKKAFKERAPIRVNLLAIKKEINEKEHLFLRSNPAPVLALSLIETKGVLEGYDAGMELFNDLSDSLKQSEEGKALAANFEVLKKSRLGSELPDFVQNSLNGKPVKFTSFRGSYLFIDFWASWCVACRAENPNVLSAYKRFKNKKFDVIGVSIDDNVEDWKRALTQDQMPWVMVSDLKGHQNEIAQYFGIVGVPSTLLIDPNGKIIARNLTGKSLTLKLEEIFEESR